MHGRYGVSHGLWGLKSFCICMCVPVLPVPISPSICHSSTPVCVPGHLPFSVRGWKCSSLKSTFLMWDFNADLLILLNQSFLFSNPTYSPLSKLSYQAGKRFQPSAPALNPPGMLSVDAQAGAVGSRKLGGGRKSHLHWGSALPALPSLPAHTGGKTSGRQRGFDIVESKREAGQKHFFPGLETSINIRCRGSTLLVCKGESCGGKM